ncbi:hypothetical protein FA15DRAFT_559264, partial [Coprinopsis marcescibilis]
EEGSRQLIYAGLGLGDNEDALRGAYLSFMKITEPSDYSISEEGLASEEKIW